MSKQHFSFSVTDAILVIMNKNYVILVIEYEGRANTETSDSNTEDVHSYFISFIFMCKEHTITYTYLPH